MVWGASRRLLEKLRWAKIRIHAIQTLIHVGSLMSFVPRPCAPALSKSVSSVLVHRAFIVAPFLKKRWPTR
jgi:hypothetical protein